jgi:translation initiation factor IF-2
MGNVRVFQLARDLDLPSQEIIDRLRKLGVDVKTASSSVDEDTADKLKRALKIDQLAARKRRIYGSDEDEAERDLEAKELEAKIAAEREERERAAEEARAAAEARKARKTRGAKAEKEEARPAGKPAVEEPPPALTHAPGAPRLAPRVAAPPPPLEAEVEEDQDLAGEEAPELAVPEEAIAEVSEAPRTEPPPAPKAPTVRAPITPRPLKPIAPPAPVAAAPPVAAALPPSATPGSAGTAAPVGLAGAAAGAVVRPIAISPPRPVRPIAPPQPVSPARPAAARPSSPHPVAGRTVVPRSPHAVGVGRPGALGARGVSPIPPRQQPTGLVPVGRPAPKPSKKEARHAKAAAAVTAKEERPVYSGPPRKIFLSEGVTVKELGEKMPDVKNQDIIRTLLSRGVMATLNQSIDPALAIELCKGFGYEAAIQSFEEVVVEEQKAESKPEDLVPRAPVVTVMGHVDHGKTSLLDAIRETSVAAGEAGGITQHIGAYQVAMGSRKVVFLDTPGHEAFTLMRARGARVTDVVVLVVAADDGVMPQTTEAIDHARAAGVPIVVAVNKIDKPGAQPDRVRQQLSDKGLMPEEWGGSTVFVDVSAKKKQNLDQLLEMLLLVADLQELKANPSRHALGTVLEARLDKGRGPVATVLVQDGTLRVGDSVVAGAVSGKVRALVDDQGARLKAAPPATPVEVLGLGQLPEPGDQLLVVTDNIKAQSIVSFRQAKLREKAMAASSRIRLEDLGKAIADGQIRELPLVLKADVQGSLEALADQFTKLPQEKVKLRIIRSGAGAISEGDVLLAAASNAVVIGFNVRPERKASEIAERDRVEVRLYTVIYDAVQEMRKAMEGMLAPATREVRLGAAEVRDTFRISKVGTIAGSFVVDGRVNRGALVRLLRDNVVIHTGKVSSLKRFKDDAQEVKSGFECGIGIAGYNDLKPGDVIEFFVTEEVKVTLE